MALRSKMHSIPVLERIDPICFQAKVIALVLLWSLFERSQRTGRFFTSAARTFLSSDKKKLQSCSGRSLPFLMNIRSARFLWAGHAFRRLGDLASHRFRDLVVYEGAAGRPPHGIIFLAPVFIYLLHRVLAQRPRVRKFLVLQEFHLEIFNLRHFHVRGSVQLRLKMPTIFKASLVCCYGNGFQSIHSINKCIRRLTYRYVFQQRTSICKLSFLHSDSSTDICTRGYV